MKFNDNEKAILREIQRDSSASLAEIAERTNMAQSTVWRKLQEFDAADIVRKRVALLNPAAVDAKLCVFASVSLADHSAEAVEGFAAMVRLHPEILECHALSGTSDYILKIRVADVEAYEEFMTHNLLRNPHVQSVVSSFSLKEMKSTTELPV
ncbi:Lrp/AsnC family transcriptional regulator [Pseudohalocynthiibacter aestuariivivens]|jgi:DNA-binding Lrp family transcriptional regulator|uniref:Lrp/AsnC family transcriptional regulator n=1 Tax=Pseudohalocynthiibacter aestuariivivens TaxID=1591409 RepID=A0ABV5JDT8_9RHOB|nr:MULTISPECIES: Lrp/AsnC family transcriptional regulator [Pseudohalocynthiibacter]MBS9715777.1 Lrp/AsnC family transcriptional regulator [Pseudohalocynthiibacter aestuariivivens]MCK0101390.1 Lrp/AsnC family transcriptional regulator [Pseudohalocynthiibacter sp. F2068]